MKIYIKSSTYRDLVLAKGIVFNDMYDKYSDYIQSSPYISETSVPGYYIASTEATYDIATKTLDGDVLNHQSLLDKINFPQDLEKFCIYFSVDLDRSGQHTELSISTEHMPSSSAIIAYLKRAFKVADSGISNRQEWLDVNSTEFKQLFRQSADEAKALVDAQHRHANGSYTGDPGYYVPRFSITFAVIDPQSNQGTVNEGPDFLFVADDFKDYTKKKKKFASELGLSDADLIFKTVFSDNYTGGKGDNLDENTGKGMRNALRSLVSAINASNPDFKITTNPTLNWAVAVKKIEGKQRELVIRIESTVIDTTLDVDRKMIILPNYTKYNIKQVVNNIEEAFDRCY